MTQSDNLLLKHENKQLKSNNKIGQITLLSSQVEILACVYRRYMGVEV